jgi:serine/threonine protein kinase
MTTPWMLGRYEIVAELGKGAMGVVYRANDPMLNRVVAIKTINIREVEQEGLAEFETRFYQEARAAGGLNHPNIVIIYDIGKSESFIYMAMEHIEGSELRSLLSQEIPLPPAQAVDIAAQIAEGLAYAHEHHVVHRDIKPANIIITPKGRAKIADFGIARMRTHEARTQTGVIMGSPKYLSPEQVVGKRADFRSDIFSLGVILYQCLTGMAPFSGEGLSSLMYQITNHDPAPPSSINPQVPVMLDYIIAKVLAKSPEARYQSATELASDLRDCARQLEAGAAPLVIDLSDTFSLSRPVAVPAPLVPPIPAPAPPPEQPAAPPNPEPDTVSPAGPSPTRGISRAFDSHEATARLLRQFGTSEPEAEDAATATSMTATAALREMSGRRTEHPWGRKENAILATTVFVALVIATTIALA